MAASLKKHRCQHILVVLVYLLLLPLLVEADEKVTLVINSGSSAPLISNASDGFYPQLVTALFARLKIKTRTNRLPSARSLKNANQGIDAGVIGRIKGLDKNLTNLIRVQEKVLDVEFTAFSNDNNLLISTWADLERHNVAYVRGWKIYDKNVTFYKSLIKVKNTRQLFNLLKNRRVDVILSQDIPGKYMMKQLNYYPYQSQLPLQHQEMFLYMHKGHSTLVPLLVKALQDLKNNGTYTRLYGKYITQTIIPVAK